MSKTLLCSLTCDLLFVILLLERMNHVTVCGINSGKYYASYRKDCKDKLNDTVGSCKRRAYVCVKDRALSRPEHNHGNKHYDRSDNLRSSEAFERRMVGAFCLKRKVRGDCNDIHERTEVHENTNDEAESPIAGVTGSHLKTDIAFRRTCHKQDINNSDIHGDEERKSRTEHVKFANLFSFHTENYKRKAEICQLFSNRYIKL